MSRLEKRLWGLVALLALVVGIVGGYRHRQPLIRLAGHAPLIGPTVQSRFPGSFAADPTGHEHDGLVDYWTCSMHPSVRRDEPGTCPICSMDRVPVYPPGAGPPGESARATGAASAAGTTGPGDAGAGASDPGVTPEDRATFRIDPTWQQAIAVTTARVARRDLTESLRTVGRVTYDENRLVDVNLKLSGWIRQLHVAETGQLVEAGEPLFDLYSPELVSAQREYLLALDNVERVASSPEPEVVERARSLADAARRRLLLWDLTPDQVDRIASGDGVVDALPIVSPATGYVVEKMAVEGMRVDPGMRLYRIADLSTVWVLADVYESDLSFVREDQPATMRLAYEPGRTWRGRVDHVYPTLEPSTRTVKVRLVFPNADLTLRPEMYADVFLERRVASVLAVPREAVLDLGSRKVVFVDLGEGRLQAREVATGPEVAGSVPIRAGLQEGDRVITSGNFLVDAESKVRGVVPLPVQEDPGRSGARPPGGRDGRS